MLGGTRFMPTGTLLQHVATSAHRARFLLGWSSSDPAESLGATVRWHLANPPQDADRNFAADDAALASV